MKQAKSRHKIAQMFDQIAVKYDRNNRLLSLGQDMKWRKSLRKYLPKKESLTILDLACGTGDQMIALSPIKARFYGIDISKEMLKIAREKLKENEQVELLLGSALDIPFDEAFADVVTMSFGIRNVTDPSLCLKEIFRVLKPEGRVLILEFSQPQKRFFRFFSDYYIHRVIPWVGKKIIKSPLPYTYLSDTIEEFPSGDAFLHLMAESGFDNLTQRKMNFGTVSLYIGEKSKHNT